MKTEKTQKEKAEYNGVDTSNWGKLNKEETEKLSQIMNQLNPVIEPDACCERDKYRYEDHLYTQRLVRRYISGRNHDMASPIKEVKETAKQQKQIDDPVDEQDKAILNAFIKAGFEAKIEKTGTCLGGCINIIIIK